MPKFEYTTDFVRIMNKTVSNYRHSRLALLVLFCSIYPVLISNTVNAAESVHKVLPANTNNCLKEIGSQLRIEGTTFVMGDDYTYREEGPANPEASRARSVGGCRNEGRNSCLLYTSPSPRDRYISRMPSSA